MIFASKTPLDTVRTPEDDALIANGDFRPEEVYGDMPSKFHNEPNPILVAFRAYSDKHGMDAEDRVNPARAWLQAPGFYERNLVTARMLKPAVRQHGHAVLTRLAAFRGEL